MKNKTKRTLSFILAMCLIVSVLPFGALAEDPVISYAYDFSGWTSGQSLAVGTQAADGSESWEFVANNKANLKGEPDLVRWKAQSAEEGVTFVAFKLTGIPYGTYTMDFDFYTQSGGGEADIYILPAASLPSTTDAIHTLLDTMTAAGTVGNYKSGAVLSPATIDSVTFSGSTDGSYVIVFRSTTNVAGSAINTTTINLRSISLTPNLTAVSPAAIDFSGWTSGQSLSVGTEAADGSGSWEYVAGYKANLKGEPDLVRWKAQSATDGETFMAFQITGIPCGIYDMDFSFYTHSGGGEADIYILPAASLPTTTDAIHTLLDGMTAAGTVGNYKSGAVLSPSSIENAVFDGSIDGDYVVVFRSTTNVAGSAINTTTINLKSFTLTPAGSALSAAVDSVVAATDAVNASYYTFAATSVVNGSDYLYLCLKGGEFWVYNVDTGTRVYNEDGIFGTPRNIYVDEDGIVWVCGNNALYKFDPFTLTSKIIECDCTTLFDADASGILGVSGGGDGMLYFGTLNHGYLGRFNPVTEQFTALSGWLNTNPNLDPDAKHSGYGGLIVNNGYIYVGIDGDMNNDGITTHEIIKYDIANQAIVDRLDISARLPSTSKYLASLNLVGDVLFGSIFGRLEQSICIDITGGDGGTDGVGDTMEFIEITNLPIGNTSEISEVVNGKVYFSGYYGTSKVQHLVEYDVATQTVTPLLQSKLALRLTGGSMVTIADDERLPGQSIMVPVNNEANGTIDLSFYNPQTNQVVTWANFTPFGDGTGQTLRSLAIDPTGQNIYVGAYGCNLVSRYDLTAGEVTATFPTYSHQSDSLRYYNGYLYAGTYSAGTITQINPDTLAATPLFSLRYTVFQQCRMHAFTAGDNKVFAGTTPYAGYGGVLVWHDLSTGLTYVAGGPNPEDVYYADTSNTDDPTAVDYTWYNAVTGEAADFDYDDDGTDDVYLADGSRRFSGPIPNQVINNIVYKDGYIYGTTSKYGSSGNDAVSEDGTAVYDGNAVLFVYDVAARKVIATCDLATALTGITGVVPIIDQLAADPAVDGKFWGVVSGTLFSFTFDAEAKTFAVAEELSFLKNDYSLPGAAWGHRDIVFDGEYMYVAFGHVGTYMIRKSDPQENYQISVLIPNSMVLGADNNLYWITNSGGGCDLNMFPIAEAATAIKNAAAAGSEN